MMTNFFVDTLRVDEQLAFGPTNKITQRAVLTLALVYCINVQFQCIGSCGGKMTLVTWQSFAVGIVTVLPVAAELGRLPCRVLALVAHKLLGFMLALRVLDQHARGIGSVITVGTDVLIVLALINFNLGVVAGVVHLLHVHVELEQHRRDIVTLVTEKLFLAVDQVRMLFRHVNFHFRFVQASIVAMLTGYARTTMLETYVIVQVGLFGK